MTAQSSDGAAASAAPPDHRAPFDDSDASPCRATGPRSADEIELAALVGRVAGQEEAALGILYDRTARRVFGLALRITRHRPIAEEVVEDCFWQVWRDAPKYSEQRGQVMSWLLSITRSRAIDALRKLARQDEHELAVDAEFLQMLAVVDELPDDCAEAEGNRLRLHRLLAELDPLSRQLLTLAFFNGLSHAEIAEHTGLPLGTVKSHVRRSLQGLKTRLQATPEENREVEP